MKEETNQWGLTVGDKFVTDYCPIPREIKRIDAMDGELYVWADNAAGNPNCKLSEIQPANICEYVGHDVVPVLGYENAITGEQCRQCGQII